MNANRQHKMDREIMFRGKRTDTGENAEWIEGSLIDYNMPGVPYRRGIRERYYGGVCPVASETVGQFTGLHDENGKEIYEGDILRYPPKSDYDKGNYAAYKVFWYDNDSAYYHIGWQMNRAHYKGAICGGYIPNFLPETVSKMVVIGNIFDNPELLKTEQP